MSSLGVSMTTTTNLTNNNNSRMESNTNSSVLNSESIKQTEEEEEGGVKGINIKDIMKNKALAKLLVSAARKIKSKEQSN